MQTSVKTINDIAAMSYTDFVGWINQWNVLPGSYNSLNKWRVFSQINQTSNLLEIACTTGFSSRELSLMSGCNATGIDISAASIESAQKNKEQYAPTANIRYECINGYEFDSNEKYSHIILGAALRFFPDPKKMLDKTISMLKDGGFILATEFYTPNPLPPALKKEAKSVFNITPTSMPYKEVMKIYQGLDIYYEDKNEIEQETDAELDHYTASTIERACQELGIKDDMLRKAMYDRLYSIKDMSNRLRPYQHYNVLVLRYNQATYPNRYVELF